MSQESEGSVSGWISQLKRGDPEAQRKIWERFVNRLVRHSNRKLGGVNRSVVDAEDIASIAFQQFFAKAPESFERLVDRNDLWQLLTLIAERRAFDQVRKWYSETKGDQRLISEAAANNLNSDSFLGLQGVPGKNEAPIIEMILAEEFETRLDSLPEEEMRMIAIEKLQGYKNQEIADRLTIKLRTVERKLNNIRAIFASAIP